MDCDVSKGWTVTTATVLHELAQEVSDFFLLVTQGGLSTLQALVVNVLSGVSVVLGAVVFLAVEPGNGTQGLILAFSAGLYVYIAATEVASTYIHKHHEPAVRVSAILAFILGAVLIGLVLLDHSHCVAGGSSSDGDPHAGHNH